MSPSSYGPAVPFRIRPNSSRMAGCSGGTEKNNMCYATATPCMYIYYTFKAGSDADAKTDQEESDGYRLEKSEQRHGARSWRLWLILDGDTNGPDFVRRGGYTSRCMQLNNGYFSTNLKGLENSVTRHFFDVGTWFCMEGLFSYYERWRAYMHEYQENARDNMNGFVQPEENQYPGELLL
ncbi:hypothetical protein TSAR_010068 [Trichomalopsis sarcophagae]|uniref:Uncharacterized protein n=1 Tax=Trichomalopsis sarcophagae TaxID=543379 RepID=A0A232FJX4_9HYME|nr:hypothetical protein TSAR_010068 [Trichomalopsis sarcophagae]